VTEGVRLRDHATKVMPFGVPWTRFEPPYLQQQGLQFYWGARAKLTPEAWDLPFAVYDGDDLVGVQSVGAESFAVNHQVNTGSWLARTAQGKGIGKQMRAAVLHLAFAELGTQVAVTSAFADNPASLGVTRSLGYEDNGSFLDNREGKAVQHLRFVLTRDRWEQHRRDDIQVSGLDPCRPLLGAE